MSLSLPGLTNSSITSQVSVVTPVAAQNDLTIDDSSSESTQKSPISRGTQVLKFLGRLYGVSKPDNAVFEEFAREIVKVTDDSPAQRLLLKQNAKRIYDASEIVLDYADEQIKQGKDPWEGLSDIGIPMSGELTSLVDDTPKQRYYHNCLAHYLANAILNDQTIVDSEDLDGTNTDKSTITFGTRGVLPFRVIKWNKNAIDASLNFLSMKYLVNTARSINPTPIYARNQGLEGSATVGILNSALEELFGFSIQEQLKYAEQIEIAAMNGSIVHRPGEWTYLSNKLLRADEFFRYLNHDFVNNYLVKPTGEYGFSAAEPKGLTDYVFDSKRVLGEAYYPHYLRIVEIKERCVDNRLEGVSEIDGWKAFRKELLENEESGVNAGLEKWANVVKIKDGIRKLIQRNEEGFHTEQSDVLERELHLALKASMPYIPLLGSSLSKASRVDTTKYTDTSDNVVDVPDYCELLQSNPRAFFNRVTNERLTAICYHFFNSRGIPKKDAIQEAYQVLRNVTKNQTVRRKIRQLNMLETNTNGLHGDIKAFVDEARNVFSDQGPKAYLEWRLLKHMMYLYERNQFDGNEWFKNSPGKLEFSDKFRAEWQAEWEKKHLLPSDEVDEYIKWIQNKFAQSNGLEAELSSYVEGIFDDTYVCDLKSGINTTLTPQCFFPDELYSINNKVAYTGEYSFYSIFTVVDKSSVLKPDADCYIELQPAKEKFSAVRRFKECSAHNLASISSGDSLSDVGTHVAALERNGIERVIYNLISDNDIYSEAIAQRLKYVKDIKDYGVTAIDVLEIASGKPYNSYGLVKVQKKDANGIENTGFIKIIAQNKKLIYIDKEGQHGELNDTLKSFTKDEIIDDVKEHYKHRTERTPSPAAKIRRYAEIIHLLTGADIEFDDEKFEAAKQRAQQSGIINIEQQRQANDYNWAVVEGENCSKISNDAPRARVYFEYYDPKTQTRYYRRRTDGKLVTKLGLVNNQDVLFKSNENCLKKIAIEEDAQGNYTYVDSKKSFDDPKFLDRCLCEEKFIPNVSPVQGLFARKGLLSFLGLGNQERGKDRLKTFVVKLPSVFNNLLEWSGGLMALGGLMRIGSSLIGSIGEPIYKAGYFISNAMRAVSAAGGALRGELNVHKYHDIFAGEMINVFSALKLPNGLKHLGLGIGNFVLFLGRSRQRVQLQQRVNNFTLDELNIISNNKLTAVEKKEALAKIIDPRPYVREVTKFSTEDTILNIKNATKDSGLPILLGEIVGNIASSILTPIKMIADVFKDPRLIFQIKPRLSEKSGEVYSPVPSAGHLLAVVGTLSGIGALIGGTVGRIGEVAEDGFNKIGKFAISFANAIPALGIIANGLEVAANPQGLPRIIRGLDKKDVRYDPKRAGFGQVIAGLGYLVLPWFGLHKDSVAAAYDVTNGLYFGLPKARMSVAEEEKLNTISLARNILIEGQELYKHRESQLLTNEDFQGQELAQAG